MELELLRWVQSFASPALDVFFQVVTMLGEQWVVVLALAAVYWLADKQTGEELAFTLLLSGLSNNILKGVFRLERPIGQEGIRSLRQHTATGYSFPSGHSQNAATLYFFPARRWGGWWYAAAAGVSLLVGLSRLYLGVHYPKDVAAGIGLGIAMAWIGPALWHRFDPIRLLGGSALLCLPLCLLLGQRDLYKAFGLLLGFWAGIAFERRFVRFSCQVPRWKKAVRLLVGLAALGVLQFGMKAVLPQAMWCDALRYALLVFAGFGAYPLLFSKAGF